MSRHADTLLSRRAVLRAVDVAGGAAAGSLLTTPSAALAAPTLGAADPALAEDVRREFLSAWNAYKQFAPLGRDELRPLSGTGSDFFLPGVDLGLTVLESLDTLHLFELDDEFDVGLRWVEDNLDFDRDGEIFVFEAIIRLVGGLLSAHHAISGQPRSGVLLEKAKGLADRLLPAFDTPTGIPYRYVNLRTGVRSGDTPALAEVGSNITEFGYLSRLTGDSRYVEVAKRALRAVYHRRSSLDLVGTSINAETGEWADRTSNVGPPADSYYEYLWDGYQFVGDTDLLSWYRTLTDAVLRYQADEVDGRLWFAPVDFETGARRDRQQSELTAFYAGLLAQGGDLAAGERHHDAWADVQAGYDLPPETIGYDSGIAALSVAYGLRPEYVDSALFLWLATGKEVYRDRARAHYESQKAYCKVDNGYAIVTDRRPLPTVKGDLTPGYWFSENMKYFYLMFADSPRFDYGDNYLTTEGNILRGFR